MPLGRKHLRRNRDAPILGWTMQRTASSLGRTGLEVNVPRVLDAVGDGQEPSSPNGRGRLGARSSGLRAFSHRFRTLQPVALFAIVIQFAPEPRVGNLDQRLRSLAD